MSFDVFGDFESYLEALTRELDRPGRGELADYLRPFVGRALPDKQASAMLAKLRGLGPHRLPYRFPPHRRSPWQPEDLAPPFQHPGR